MYFKNFYAFRFFAAIAIVWLHTELMAGRFGWKNGAVGPLVEWLSLGVDFFFVLSGFLITSLLDRAASEHRLCLRRFYMRRALRVLPMYYLTTVVVFCVVPWLRLPHLHGMSLEKCFKLQFGLHLAVLPHVAKSFLDFVPYGGHLWTIGVEVMFYALWPVLFVIRPRFSTAVYVIAICIVVKVLALIALGSAHCVSAFLAMTRLEVLMMGGAAYFIHVGCLRTGGKRRRVSGVEFYLVSVLRKRRNVLSVLFLSAATTLAFWLWLDDAVHLVAGIFFATVLIASSQGLLESRLLENRLVCYLGEISYSVYLWHFIVIGVVANILLSTTLDPRHAGVVGWVLFYFGSSVTSVLVAAVMYELFEKPVNNLRHHI